MNPQQKSGAPDCRIRAGVGLIICLLLGPLGARSEDLIENGSFDHADGALAGWITDYEWTGNKYYVANKDRVAVVPELSGRSQVVTITPAGDAGAKMECIPIPFEPGYRYSCELEIMGGPYRIYFAGYKWQPGIRPHEDPELGETLTARRVLRPRQPPRRFRARHQVRRVRERR